MPPLDILFIEDNPADHLLAERALRNAGLLGHGLRVDHPDLLRQALEVRRWDVLLSDYSVPGMPFTQTLSMMLRLYPQIPILLVSATVGEAKAAVLLQLGVRAYVPKSQLSELPGAIEKVLTDAASSFEDDGSEFSDD